MPKLSEWLVARGMIAAVRVMAMCGNTEAKEILLKKQAFESELALFANVHKFATLKNICHERAAQELNVTVSDRLMDLFRQYDPVYWIESYPELSEKSSESELDSHCESEDQNDDEFDEDDEEDKIEISIVHQCEIDTDDGDEANGSVEFVAACRFCSTGQVSISVECDDEDELSNIYKNATGICSKCGTSFPAKQLWSSDEFFKRFGYL